MNIGFLLGAGSLATAAAGLYRLVRRRARERFVVLWKPDGGQLVRQPFSELDLAEAWFALRLARLRARGARGTLVLRDAQRPGRPTREYARAHVRPVNDDDNTVAREREGPMVFAGAEAKREEPT